MGESFGGGAAEGGVFGVQGVAQECHDVIGRRGAGRDAAQGLDGFRAGACICVEVCPGELDQRGDGRLRAGPKSPRARAARSG